MHPYWPGGVKLLAITFNCSAKMIFFPDHLHSFYLYKGKSKTFLIKWLVIVFAVQLACEVLSVETSGRSLPQCGIDPVIPAEKNMSE